MKAKIRYFIKVLLMMTWATLLFVFILWFGKFLWQHGLVGTKILIQDWLIYYQKWAIFAFLLMFNLRALLFLPITLFFAVSGLIFPLEMAVGLSFLGMLSSACLMYFISSFIGREFISKREAKWIQKTNQKLYEKGFFTVLILIIMPIFSLDATAVLAGISRITFGDFLLGVIVSTPASMLPYIFVGKGMDDPMSLIIAGVLFAGIMALTYWAWKHPHFERFLNLHRGKNKK